MFSINKRAVKTVAQATAGFTAILDGLAEQQREVAENARIELEVLQAKVDVQLELQNTANREVADAEIASQNLVDMLTKGTSQENV